ncbi:hypothetical protein D3C83_231640 [compost metagenome]
MWQRAFVGMTVLAGDSLDDALVALAALPPEAHPEELIARLRAPQRLTRASALAEVGRDVALAINELALR